jgi:AAHS family 4-hydroxybenzoate transporter-like MFS transporter
MNQPNTVDVSEFIDQQKVARFQILVLVLCALSTLVDGFDAVAIGYVAPVVSKLWRLPPGAFKSAMSIGLFGLMFGALVAGPLADRFGRKTVIIYSSVGFGLFSLLCVTAHSLTELTIWRFLTGVGLGGAMPNALALISEYSPRRRRSTMTVLALIGFNVGSSLTGFIAAALIPAYGWTSVFWVGGIAPLVLCAVFIFVLPESPRLLALRGNRDAQVGALLRRINRGLSFTSETRFVAHDEARLSGFAVRHLFTESRALGTVLIWVMCFMNLLNLYFCLNWLPTVFVNAGLSISQSAAITALLQAAGIVSTILLGIAGDRLNPFSVLGFAYFAAGIFTAFIGVSVSSMGFLVPVVFLSGFFLNGGQNLSQAVVAGYYPTLIRSTGLSWAGGIGRIGSIVGPFLGGIILSFQWNTQSLFLITIVPAFCAAAAAFIMAQRQRRGRVLSPARNSQ